MGDGYDDDYYMDDYDDEYEDDYYMDDYDDDYYGYDDDYYGYDDDGPNGKKKRKFRKKGKGKKGKKKKDPNSKNPNNKDPNNKDPNSKNPNNKDPNNKDPNNKDPNKKKNPNKKRKSKKTKPGASKKYKKKDCVRIKLNLVLDKYPEDIDWKITSESDGKIVMSGNNYTKRRKLKLEQCAKAGCYTFDIKDEFGDGLAKGGKYDLYYKDTVVKKNGGKFGEKETIKFGDN